MSNPYRPPSAVRNGFYNALATGVMTLCSIIGSIVIVRTLSPEAYGVFSYYGWLAGVLCVLGALAFPKALTKVTAELRGRGQFDEAKALVKRVALGLVSLNMAISLAVVLWALSTSPPTRTYLLIIACIPIFHTLLRVLISSFWGQQRYRPVAFATALPALIQLLLIGLSYTLRWGLAGYLLAVLSVNITGALMLFGFALLQPRPPQALPVTPPAPTTLKRYLAFAAPATLMVLIDAVVWQRSEVFFLQRYSSYEEVGYYSLAFSILTIFSIIGLALVGGFFPSLSHDYGAGEWRQIHKKIHKAALLTTLFAVPLSLGGWVTLEALLELLYGPAMLPATRTTHILFSGLLFVVSTEVFSITLAALDRLWLSVRLGLAIAILNIVLNLILIPPFGAYGAALSNIAAQFSYSVLAFLLVKHVCHLTLPWRRLGGVALVGSFTTLLLPIALLSWFSTTLVSLALTILVSALSYGFLVWRLGFLQQLRDHKQPERPLRVLHLLGDRSLPRQPDAVSTSGVVRAALEIARAQRQRGYTVVVASVGRNAWQSEWHGIELVSLRSVPLPKLRLGSRRLDLRVHLPYIVFTAKRRFDIVHTHLHNYTRWLRADARVVHIHGDPFQQVFVGENPAMQPADFRSLARHSDAQIAVGRFIAGQLERGFTESGSRGNVQVVNNGVPHENFIPALHQSARKRRRTEWGIKDQDVVFAFVGAIVPEKGVWYLARAFAALRRCRSNVHLVLAGSSKLWLASLSPNDPHASYEKRVHEVLEPLRACGAGHPLGAVSASAIAEVYAAADVVVVPSVMQEPFSLVILEALASGKPVIGSAVGGIPEVINASNGLLVPAEDENALIEAMLELLQPEYRERLARQALSSASQYSWQAAVGKLDSIYRHLLDKEDVHAHSGVLDMATR